MQDRPLMVLQFTRFCMVLGALTSTAHAQSQGSWTMKAPIPLARNEVALAPVRRKSPRDWRERPGCGGDLPR